VAGILLFVRKNRLPLLALCDLVAPSMMLGLAIGRIGCLLNGCCYGAVCDHPWAITFPAGSPVYVAQVERGQMYGMRLNSDPKTEPRVQSVAPGSPAALAGLRAGDRLESINEQALPATGWAWSALQTAFEGEQPLRIDVAGPRTVTIPAVKPRARSLPVQPTQIYSTIDGLLLCLLLVCYAPFRRRDGEVFALLMSIYPVTRFLVESLRSDEAAVFGTGLTISQNVSLMLLICAAALWFYVLRQPKGTAFDP
jgi:phosphatidylglycerol:prolipoprotein diacylglycerol transferase